MEQLENIRKVLFGNGHAIIIKIKNCKMLKTFRRC